MFYQNLRFSDKNNNSSFIFPTMLIMVYHLFCHTTIYANILSSNESCLIGAQEQNHICNVCWITYSSYKLLDSVRTFIDYVTGFNPSGRNGIYSDFPGKTHRKCMR